MNTNGENEHNNMLRVFVLYTLISHTIKTTCVEIVTFFKQSLNNFLQCDQMYYPTERGHYCHEGMCLVCNNAL